MTGAGQCACEWSGHALKVVCIAHLEAVREFDGLATKPAESFRVFCPAHDKHEARYHSDRPMLDDRCPACANNALLLEVEGLKAALDKYGRHFGWCAAISSRNTAEGCSCGFDAALSPASGGGEAAALPSQDSAPQTRVANLNKVHSEALQDIWWVCESRMRAEQKVAEIRKITANQDLE